MDLTTLAMIGGAVLVLIMANMEWVTSKLGETKTPAENLADAYAKAVSGGMANPAPALVVDPETEFMLAVKNVRALTRYFEKSSNAMGAKKANELGQLLFTASPPLENIQV